MKVKNDFPNVDRVLSKLKEYVNFFESNKDDEFAEDNLKEVDKFIDAIEEYLDSVCNDEDRIKRFKDKNDSNEDVQTYIEELDMKRTLAHSSIISSMVIIDRISDMNGIARPFDYADEFLKDAGPLMPDPKDKSSKSRMTTRERIKRREMGNFGLYIAASVTVGLEMDDREVRDFASCESEEINWSDSSGARQASYYKVKSKIRPSDVSKNMNDMVK